MNYAAIVIAYGQEHLTDPLLIDLQSEDHVVDTYVVDNMGNYEAKTSAKVIRPGTAESLRWCRGTNWGYQYIKNNFKTYDGWFFLNNDLRLSPGFCQELIEAEAKFALGTVAPIYDDVWEQQKQKYDGPAKKYRKPIPDDFWEVGFFDGAGWYAREEFLRDLQTASGVPNVLDEEFFGQFGWGAIEDYAIRARAMGAGVWVSNASYMNHFRGATYKATKYFDYELEAGGEMVQGIVSKYGQEGWKLLEL